MADLIFGILIVNHIKYYLLCHFFAPVDTFQLCLKTAASLLPFSCMTFLIKEVFNHKESKQNKTWSSLVASSAYWFSACY